MCRPGGPWVSKQVGVAKEKDILDCAGVSGGTDRGASYRGLGERKSPLSYAQSTTLSVFKVSFFACTAWVRPEPQTCQARLCPLFYLEAGSHYIAQAGLELAVFLHQPPEQLGLQVCTTVPAQVHFLIGHS